MKSRVCELCNEEASLYCVSDSAFLCWNCDSKVHEANFLVARHVRRTLCYKCKKFDGNHISGVGFRHRQPICRSCVSESDEESSCTSSTCISASKSFISRRKMAKIVSDKTSFSPAKFSGDNRKRVVAVESVNVDVKAEGILVNWCRKLGLKNNNFSISLALHALSLCLRRFTNFPFRVSLSSSLWLSLKRSEGVSVSTCQNLKRLEEITGVPAKVILLAEKKISRVLNINRRSNLDTKEGWAECSD